MLNTAHAATTRADHRCPRADRDRAAARAARRPRGTAALRPLRARRPGLPRDVRRRRPDRSGRGAGRRRRRRRGSCTSARCRRGVVRGDRRAQRARRLPRLRGLPARGGTACRLRDVEPRDRHVRARRPADGAQPRRPDGLYGASKVWGEALGRLYVDKFGLEVVCLRIGSFQPRPRERRELATWLSHADGIRLFQASLTADDVGFAIVYGASANTRRWWPADDVGRLRAAGRRGGFVDELDGPDVRPSGRSVLAA